MSVCVCVVSMCACARVLEVTVFPKCTYARQQSVGDYAVMRDFSKTDLCGRSAGNEDVSE